MGECAVAGVIERPVQARIERFSEGLVLIDVGGGSMVVVEGTQRNTMCEFSPFFPFFVSGGVPY